MSNSKQLTRAQKIFVESKDEYKELIRDALREEREVMHLKRRSDIHTKLYNIVKRVIK